MNKPIKDRPVQSKEKDTTQKRESGKRIRTKYATYSIAVILVVIAIAIGVNVVLTTIENNYNIKIDLTQNAVYNLSDQTKQVINHLDQDIVFFTLFRSGEDRANSKLITRISNILAKYKDYTPQIRIENVDPLINPAFAQQFDREGKGIAENSIIVSNADKSRFKVISLGQLFVLDKNNKPVGIDAEQKFTSAIYFIKTGKSSNARFLQGHSETALSNLGALVQVLQYTNAEVSIYNSLTDVKPLDPRNDVLVIVSPKSDLSDAEREVLTQYVTSGGKILAMMDPVFQNNLANFRSLFDMFHIGMNDNVVLESDNNQYYKQPINLVPRLVKMPLTQPLIDAGLAPILPLCRSLSLPENADTSTSGVMPMLMSTENAYAKTDENQIEQPKQSGDPSGPFVLAAAAYFYNKDNPSDVDLRSKLILFGSSQFATEPELMQTQGNINLLLNSVGWLLNRADAVSIDSKYIGNQTFLIQSESAAALLIILLALMPLTVIGIGIAVYIKRKNL